MRKSADEQNQYQSRREFLATALAAPLLAVSRGSAGSSAADVISIASPDRRVRFDLLWRDQPRLSYQVAFNNRPVIETSPLGIIVDAVDLGQGTEVGKATPYRVDEKYPSRGVHSQATNRCNGVRVPIKHMKSGTSFTLDVRAFNDGIAFRFVIPGDHGLRAPDEASAFTIPAGSTVWYHDFEGHYEGVHVRKEISEVQAGAWAATPLTIKLPDNAGYAAITEAALVNYSGMALQADGRRVFRARLAHSAPVSYPFRLRYGAEEGKRLANLARISGTITSPWRAVMIGPDLNALVNSDIVSNLSPAPDKKLFPAGTNTAWIKPGRCVWKYLDGGANTLEEMKEFSRLAGQLGFEYNLVEGFWQRWSDSQLKELIDYSNQCRVKIWLWKHSREIRDPAARRSFFSKCRALGVAGVKLDFFDHEAKEIIDLYQAALRDAAEFNLMVDFHGANKPAGEARTWPNEMTREGVYGLEHKSMQAWSQHNTTLPFTRLLAGHADYTPVHFGERRRETSWAHQIASAAIFTSPLLVYAAHPKNILENPAAQIIQTIPSVWDETIALPVCEIGQIAAFARRTGGAWFLAIMNGPAARTIQIPLAFLARGRYQALLARDQQDNAAAIKLENTTVSRTDMVTIELRAGGGFIARFSPAGAQQSGERQKVRPRTQAPGPNA
jgi:alpha-glucosidase